MATLYFENETCQVLIDVETKRIIVTKALCDEWITTLDYKCYSLIHLSETFRDEVGYAVAVEALTTWKIERKSPLWTLGHKGGRTHWNN